MKEIRIKIDNQEYPCRPTMGAMLRFKKETGREASTLTDTDLEGNITFLWCCIVSACKHDGQEFGLSLLDFADAIGLDEIAGWVNELNQASTGGDADGEKKTRLR